MNLQTELYHGYLNTELIFHGLLNTFLNFSAFIVDNLVSIMRKNYFFGLELTSVVHRAQSIYYRSLFYACIKPFI